MTKMQFLLALHDRLAGLPQDEKEERLNFYSEMIEDRMEEGLSEEQAVDAIGSVDAIVAQIIADTPLTKITKEKIRPKRRLKVWEIVLLALGAPLWASLLIAALAVVFALYISLWAVIVSFWAVFAAAIGCTVAGVVGGTIVAVTQNVYGGLVLIAAGIVCAGLAVFLGFGCKAATKGGALLTRKAVLSIKKKCVGKEKVG